MGELLEKNLDNIQTDIDLFGEKIEKLSMRDRIGFMPISIWQPDWSIVKELKKIVADNGEERVISEKSKIFRKGGRYGATNNVREVESQASIFNPHLAQMIISAYCPSNASIYDPFGGGGTRGFIASAMGHKYLGVEIRQNEVDRIKKQMVELDKHFQIECADSQKYIPEENSYDFSYTCPPYYNLEIYSELENDMSNAKDYSIFLNMLKESYKNVYKALKKDSLFVCVLGNFRDSKKNLVSFNSDTIKICKEIGFNLHDELIFWGASGNACQRVGNFVANRRSVRVHEYILIFKK